MTGVVFDTGALIALERDARELMVIVAEARKGNHRSRCPLPASRSTVTPGPHRDLPPLPNVRIIALDDGEARMVGLLLAKAGAADIVDRHAPCAVSA